MALGALQLFGLGLAYCFLQVLAGTKNPFVGRALYINPKNAQEFESSIATASGKTKDNLKKMQHVPSAYWIDTKDKIRGSSTNTVEGILKDASSKSPAQLVIFMWYDLPNRDCDAKASNGEICCTKGKDGRCDYEAPGDCADGIKMYMTEYVDPFVSVLQEYQEKVPIVLVMEPDGLANLATNLAHPHCGNIATQMAYKKGVKYAIEQLSSKAPSVSIYIDAAHGGWLGWENNLDYFVKMLKTLDIPWSSVRGFATNVANYQPLGIQCPWCPDQGFRNGYCLNGKHQDDPCCKDPCKLNSQYNFGNNEMNYAAGLVAAAGMALGIDAHVIIDTGRNGRTSERHMCSNWCNPRRAGAGVPSTTNTANQSLVDAYFWLKTPGESDGCTGTLPDGSRCPRFDSMCSSEDSIGGQTGEPNAPEAGHWFDYQVKQLADYAKFEAPASELKDDGAECPASGIAGQPQQPVQTGPSPSSSSETSRSSGTSMGTCAAAYQQCGGTGWTGPTCCQDGCTCAGTGGYYSQCIPPSGKYACSSAPMTPAWATSSPIQQVFSTQASEQATTQSSVVYTTQTPSSTQRARSPAWNPTPAPEPSGGFFSPFAALLHRNPSPTYSQTTSPAPSPVPSPVPSGSGSAGSAGQCAVPYSQCGGKGWNGPTCCDVYCTCHFRNNDLSECVPKSIADNTLIVRKDSISVSFPTPSPLHFRSVVWLAFLGGVPIAISLAALAVARYARAKPQQGCSSDVAPMLPLNSVEVEVA